MTALTDPVDMLKLNRRAKRPVPAGVQIISTILFGAFAITAVVLAFNAHWLVGTLLAVLLGWRGGFAPGMPPAPSPEEIAEYARALSPSVEPQRRSGNSSFDAYRGEMLQRLEDEQDRFESFLDRLRDAKDRSEFDTFMDERAQIAAEAREADTRLTD